MKRLPLAAALVACSALMFAQEAGKPGHKLEKLNVSDLSGAPVTLSTTGKITALIFVATQCPISNDYNERMMALVNDYAPRRVDFVLVNSNATEPAEETAKHAKDHGFTVKVWKDHGNKLADQLNAQVTPEVFLFDKSGTIVYHGAIDDSRNAANITKKHFREALDAALAGKPVPTAEVKAFGCTIKRVKKET